MKNKTKRDLILEQISQIDALFESFCASKDGDFAPLAEAWYLLKKCKELMETTQEEQFIKAKAKRTEQLLKAKEEARNYDFYLQKVRENRDITLDEAALELELCSEQEWERLKVEE